MGSLKEILRRNRKYIIEEIEDCAIILETLYQKELLGKRQYQEIKSKTIHIDAVAYLLDCIENLGEVGFFSFCDCLREDYPWIEKRLLTAANDEGLTENTITSTRSNSVKSSLNFDDHFLSKCPSEKQLLQICKSLSVNDWEILGLELGLSSNEIDLCKHSSNNFIMQAHGMLVLWTRRKPEETNFRNLINALNNCDLQHVIHKINDIVL